MPDSSEEQEAKSKNQEIIEKLREAFRPSELRLTNDVEPLTIFSPAPVDEEAE